ncbi:glycosyltransferase involved in cell wall biosynthesis [Pseudomonas sp. BS3782 TE3695]|uniref:glycosyltransferase family 4 protein n=1 Tax=Pseudomonas sp. BS3782 TE3695 TaxID=3349323 RepID=UPI003D1A019E
MKVAIIHDWLVTLGGAEKVLKEILTIYPEADIFTVVDFLTPEQRTEIFNKKTTTSFIQKLPFAKKNYRSYLPLMPIAIEQFDLSSYNLIISSSHAVAKGVLTGPDQLHICYCHSPIRYAWDMQAQYLRDGGLSTGIKSWLTRTLLHRIRIWDHRTSNGVDHFICNSDFISRRIWKIYRRKSTVIHPSVAIENFTMIEKKEDFYLTASRLVPYKKIDLIVDAFKNMPDRKLVVIGDGPQFNKIKENAAPNIEILGYQEFSVLRDYMERARAFVFAAEEDFGIIPVEAQACGTPVIAFSKGGALETVIDGETGVFFPTQTAEAIQQAVDNFEKSFIFSPALIRANAEKFSSQNFRNDLKSFVDKKIAQPIPATTPATELV